MDEKIVNLLERIPKDIIKWTCKDFKTFFEEIDVSTKVLNKLCIKINFQINFI